MALTLLYNWASNIENTYLFNQSEIHNTISFFYTDSFINSIYLYFDDTFIAEGICIKDSVRDMYRIQFFIGEENSLHIDKLPKTTEIYFLKKTNIPWGNVYYEPDIWESFIYERDDTVIKNYKNLYNENINLIINSFEFNLEFNYLKL